MPVHTDITVTHNRPDLIYIDKLNNKTYLIDITVPSDYNIGAKEIEKLSKYHLLKTEVSRLWNTQVTVIPIVIGSTGVVAKSLKRYIDKLDANIDITILQKQAAIHTSIIIKLSLKWIKKQQISSNLESSIFAIQDNAVMIWQHQRDILKESVDGKCRLCACKDETVQHILSGCEKLAGTHYVKRHNNLVQYVYWCLAKKHRIVVSSLWWKETMIQPQVKENNSTKIL
ncbi:hypothetical protein ACJJTC_012369 [Scirpophaga incertulas]